MKTKGIETTEMLQQPDDVNQAIYEAEGLAKISKEIKKSTVFVNKEQLRALVDAFYQAQDDRINKQNRLRAFKQSFDTESEDVKNSSCTAMEWLYQDARNREAQIKAMLEEYAKHNPVCSWMMATKGIGPLIATQLFAFIDMNRCPKAANLISYSGMNDNNIPWLGTELANKLVKEAYESCGLKPSDQCNEQVVAYLMGKTKRSAKNIMDGMERSKSSSKNKISDYNALKSYLAKPPYSLRFKQLCFKIQESFKKVYKRDSMYGRLYSERKAYELEKNERGDYADQAARLLSEKNYSKGTDTYKCLIQGKLSDAHIDRRALRWTCKIYLNHVFEAMYTYTYKQTPPEVYAVEHLGHVDYIEPEVPYKYLKDL